MQPIHPAAGPRSPRNTAQRYALAVAATAAAVALSVAFGPYISRAIFVMLWPAVIFSAWFCGLGPALLAALGGVLAIDYYLIPPFGRFIPDNPIDLPQIAVFTLAAYVISRLAAREGVLHQQVRAANADLAAANVTLQEQAVELEQTVEEAQAINEELEVTNEELRVASEAEQTGRDRLAFLAHAGEVLGSSLDYETTLRQVAELAIAHIADWCVVEINDAAGARVSRTVAHRDPARVRWADEIDRRYPQDPTATSGAPQVLRSGQPELYAHIADEMIVAAARDAEHLRLLREVGFHGVIIVPIVGHERVLGTLSFVSAESARTYSPEDLTLAMDLGRRAGAAVENARLLGEAERSAERSRRLQSFAAALNMAATAEAVAEAAVVHGFDALGAQSGSLALLVDEGTAFQTIYSRGYEAALSDHYRHFPVTAGLPLSDVVVSGEPVVLANQAEIAERVAESAAVFAQGGIAAFVAIPLFASGRALGALSFSFAQAQEFGDAVRSFLLTLGEQTAQALERAHLLEAEREAREAAEAANQAKGEFLSAMSHELRTPLNAIGGYAELLEMGIRGPVTEAQRHDLSRIRRAQRRLLGLVSDILNFARIEAGRIEYRIGAVAVGPLIAELEALVEPQVREKSLVFECGGCSSELVALGDAERIQQILLNLLGNAVKFTAAGTVRIDAQAEGDRVHITVSDTGAGIAAEMHEAIFDPFVQVGRGHTEGQQGVGLGLAISRELALAMSGALTVASRPGGGSRFTLTLPRAEQGAAGEARMEQAVEEPG